VGNGMIVRAAPECEASSNSEDEQGYAEVADANAAESHVDPFSDG
jgi:hypothetical protein